MARLQRLGRSDDQGILVPRPVIQNRHTFMRMIALIILSSSFMGMVHALAADHQSLQGDIAPLDALQAYEYEQALSAGVDQGSLIKSQSLPFWVTDTHLRESPCDFPGSAEIAKASAACHEHGLPSQRCGCDCHSCRCNCRTCTTWQFKHILLDDWAKVPRCHSGEKLGDYYYNGLWASTGDVFQDYRHFYQCDTLACLTVGVGIHAILANTDLDENFQDWVDRRAATRPNALAVGRHIGEWTYVVPFMFSTYAVDGLIRRSGWCPKYERFEIGQWAAQTNRAFLVGAPVNGILQVLIGASRPGESTAGSRWKPFDDDKGSSGHAFIGAVPFLVAAKYTDRPLLKTACLLGSTVSGASRVYDDKHFLSQALLGYWLAHLAVEATEQTEHSERRYRVVPTSINGSFAIGIEFRR